MVHKRWVLLVLSSVAWALVGSWAVVASAQVVVFPAEQANITDDEADAINAVFADAYAEVTPKRVTLAQVGAVEAEIEAQPSLQQRARDLAAEEYIVLRATRLSQRIILTAARYSVDGKEIHRVRMTAASLDDIEPAALRMARALHERTDTQETITLDTVTEREGQKKNRTFSEKVMGVKASFDYVLSSGSYQPLVTIGFNGRLEGKQYFLEMGAGFMLPASGGGSTDSRAVGGLYAEFGADYYLTNTNISPYVGGGVMPRLLGGEGVDFGANIAVFGQFGLMFFRQSSSRFYTDLRVAQNLTPWRGTIGGEYDLETGGYTAETTTGSRYPTELILAFGVGW